MPGNPSRMKTEKQDAVRALRNRSKKSEAKTIEKKFLTAIEASEKETATELLVLLSSKLDKMAKQNTIHANKAARKKSRLQAMLNKTFA